MAAATIVGSVLTTMAHAQTSLHVDANLAPLDPSVGDAVVAWAASQNNNVPDPIYAANPADGTELTTWVSPGTTVYSVSGDSFRRPMGFLVYAVTDEARRTALGTVRFRNDNPNGGRWGVHAVVVRGARLSDYATWATGPFSTSSNAAAAARTLPAVTVPQDDTLVLAGYSAQMPSSVAPQTVSWSAGWTELSESASATSGTTAHQVTSVAAKTANAGDSGTAVVTATTNPASASGYLLAIPPANATPPAPTPTTMSAVAHRGRVPTRPETDEEKVSSLPNITAPALRVSVGPEVDNRVVEGVSFLNHDERTGRTSSNGTDIEVATATVAQMDAAGIERTLAYINACIGRGFRQILIQHYGPATVAAVQPLVDLANAHPLRSRIILMTSATANPCVPQLREAGWAGRIGVYGMTAANWTSTYQAQFATYGVHVGFTPPGAYTANRAHAQAMKAAGYAVGMSTENSSTQWAQGHADGIDYVLTDDPGAFLALYEPPANPVDAQLAAALPALAAAATAATPVTAAVTGTLPPLTGSASAATPAGATVAATLPAITASAQATNTIQAGIAGTLPALTATAAAATPTTATAAATLPALTGSATATTRVTAALATTLPALTASLAANVVTGVPATLAATLPALTGSATAATPVTAQVAATLTPLSASAAAAVAVTAAVAATLPAVTAALAGDTGGGGAPVQAQLAVVLPALVAAATAATTVGAVLAGLLPALRVPPGGAPPVGRPRLVLNDTRALLELEPTTTTIAWR